MRTSPLAAAVVVAAALVSGSCDGGPAITLWLNSPRDGVVTLEDREPIPF